MPPTPLPLRIAQTSNEAKKQYKQHGPRIPERQLKQLERGHELDTRAARLREAEERRRAGKKKREEREEKDKAARKQMGVGLATQLIGYSHTQAQLKKGMEAFLGLKRPPKDEDAELAKKLDEIAQAVDKEPWDDDDDDADDIALDLPPTKTSFEQYAQDDLDDDTLLQAHDLVMPDPVGAPASEPQLSPAPSIDVDADFTRLHGPVNKAVERILDKLPGPLVELLSQDISMKLPHWDPAPSLLHRLNPLALPPHRLRIKVGSLVSLLRDLNTSSQLSKSQHLRVLRVENHRLECLVLDGQLQGTKAFLTRIPFPAKYRNQDAYPFQRTQFPIRIATEYTPSSAPRHTSQAGFKTTNLRPQANTNRAFKPPGLPASNSAPPMLMKPAAPIVQHVVAAKTAATDGWDDFLESGTQIARELSSESTSASVSTPAVARASPSISESLPPLSTQDLDFSMDDLDDVVTPAIVKPLAARKVGSLVKPESLHASRKVAIIPTPNTGIARSPMPTATTTRQPGTEKASRVPLKSKLPAKKVKSTVIPIDLSTLTPSQKPRSVPDHHPKMNKRRAYAPPTDCTLSPAKRPWVQPSRPTAPKAAPKAAPMVGSFTDFCISTQEAASFFDDDDDFMFGGSPPITA